MKATYLLSIILLLQVKITCKSCATTYPSSPADCQLSESDKTKYKYCCYEQLYGISLCFAYDEDGYQEEKEFMDKMGGKMICGEYDNQIRAKNTSNLTNLSILFLIILMILY